MDHSNNGIDLEQAKSFALGNVARGVEKVSPVIDKMTSASLKRVLKAITMIKVGEEIIKGKTDGLSVDEQNLVDMIFEYQENVLGYLQLTEELNNEVVVTEESKGEENVVD